MYGALHRYPITDDRGQSQATYPLIFNAIASR